MRAGLATLRVTTGADCEDLEAWRRLLLGFEQYRHGHGFARVDLALREAAEDPRRREAFRFLVNRAG